MAIRFDLPSVLTIYSVGETRDALLAWLARQDFNTVTSIEIAAHAVDEIDGAGAQLLGSLAQTLIDTGLTWEICQPSQPILDACARMGIDKWLRCDIRAGVAS